MKRLPHAIAFLLCACLAAAPQAASPQPNAATFILLSDTAPPLRGFLIASGPHKGQFTPCNTTDFIDIAGKKLARSNEPCPAIQGDTSPMRPMGKIVDPLWFSSSSSLNAAEMSRILKDDKAASRFLKTAGKSGTNAAGLRKTFPTIYNKS
jgi:hypothetical protein